MAVIPMQKVQLIVYDQDVEATLEVIQRLGALEFKAVEDLSVAKSQKIESPNAQLLPLVQHAVQFLEPYAPKVSLWRTLREGSVTELTEDEIMTRMQATDVVKSVVTDLEELQVEFAEKRQIVRALEEKKTILEDWKELPIALKDLSTKRTVTRLVTRERDSEEKLEHQITEKLGETELPYSLVVISDTKVAVTLPKDDHSLMQAEQWIESIGATIISTPEGKETPKNELRIVEEKLAVANDELALLHDQAEHFAISHYKNLCVATEVLSWQRDRYAVIDSAATTKHTTVFGGWLDSTKRTIIEAEFAKVGVAAVFVELQPADGEEPPVEIVNHSFIQPFEAVTRLYGMPGSKDLDPTIFLAGFFFLFFGMSLTDVGYGLFLMAVSLIILTLFKVAPAIRMFSKLLFFVGLATVLVGMLFGGYLGIAPEYIPDFLKALQVYDPIGNPLPVFYTALGLGVIQVMAGMIIKIYSDYRNGQVLDGVLDQGPWLFVFVMLIVYLGISTGYVTELTESQAINLLYVGVAMIVLASMRKADTVFGAIQKALLSLYNSIGYFSDILSYSRLLALGLATTALAFAVNLIASMVFDVPYVGAILALAILVVGHLFTLAVNTLGAFIHSARLQFVEFFGKFISGTGRQFTPLSRTRKYIAVKDD